jgi:hypothetical protein
MMGKKVAVRVLGTGLFVCSAALLGLAFSTVASAKTMPVCPPCHPIMLTCDGSTCTCKQTGVDTGVWECREHWIDE